MAPTFAFLNLLIGVIVSVIDKESRLDEKLENVNVEREEELLRSIQNLQLKLEKYNLDWILRVGTPARGAAYLRIGALYRFFRKLKRRATE